MIFRHLSFALCLASLIACGGRVESDLLGSSGGGASSGGASSGGASSGGSSGTNCLAYPTCDPGDQFLADITCNGNGEPCAAVACPPDQSCYTRETCGSTIVCARQSVCDAALLCDAGYVPVTNASECAQDVPCYPVVSCGVKYWCTPDTVNCAGFPSCEPGEREVRSGGDRYCSLPGANCHPVSVCGATIWCATELFMRDAGAPNPR